jgi:hypothetical protein
MGSGKREWQNMFLASSPCAFRLLHQERVPLGVRGTATLDGGSGWGRPNRNLHRFVGDSTTTARTPSGPTQKRGDGGGNHVQGSRIGQTIVLAVEAVKNIITGIFAGMSAADPSVGWLHTSRRRGRVACRLGAPGADPRHGLDPLACRRGTFRYCSRSVSHGPRDTSPPLGP